MSRLILVWFLLISSVVSANDDHAKAIWAGSTESKEYKILVSNYPELEQLKFKNYPKITFDHAKSNFAIQNRKSGRLVFLASMRSVSEKSLSSLELRNLIQFTSDCEDTSVEIAFLDTKPEKSGVYLDNSKIGTIEDGRFGYTTGAMCRESKMKIELSKSDCKTLKFEFLIPKDGKAAFEKENVVLKCSRRTK